MIALLLLAVASFALPNIVIDIGRAKHQTWIELHRTLGFVASFSALGWAVVLAIGFWQLGRKVLWALLALPLVLYWETIWLLGHFAATFS
jgi:hypothetical protein